MTTTQGTAEDMVAVAAMAGETMVEWLRDLEGFEGLVMLSNDETRHHARDLVLGEQGGRRAEPGRPAEAARPDHGDGERRGAGDGAYDVAFADLSSFRDADRPD